MSLFFRRLVAIAAVVVILFVSIFSRTIGFVVALTVVMAYLFACRNKKISDVVLVFLVFSCLVGGPIEFKNQVVNLMKEIKGWSDHLKINGFNLKTEVNGWIMTLSVPSGAVNSIDSIKKKEPYKSKQEMDSLFLAKFAKSITKTQIRENLIDNGDFLIPLENDFSPWGHGLYSDRIRQLLRDDIKAVWINFGGANATISVEPTEIGNALKISNPDMPKDHRVGVMEQKIRVTPGTYKLSYWAKAEDDFEARALMFSTTDDWVGQPELPDRGPFDWKEFPHEIEIKKSGLITFSIVSKGKGTVYLTDVALTKQSSITT